MRWWESGEFGHDRLGRSRCGGKKRSFKTEFQGWQALQAFQLEANQKTIQN